MFPSTWEGSGQAKKNRLNVSICLYTWNDAHFFINAASFLLGNTGAVFRKEGRRNLKMSFYGRQEG